MRQGIYAHFEDRDQGIAKLKETTREAASHAEAIAGGYGGKVGMILAVRTRRRTSE